MKALLLPAASALTLILATPLSAAAQAPVAAASAAAPSVDKTPIGALWANPAAKAVLMKEIPAIAEYLDQVKDMTLVQVAPMSDGRIDDAKLKAIQAQFDKLK